MNCQITFQCLDWIPIWLLMFLALPNLIKSWKLTPVFSYSNLILSAHIQVCVPFWVSCGWNFILFAWGCRVMQIACIGKTVLFLGTLAVNQLTINSCFWTLSSVLLICMFTLSQYSVLFVSVPCDSTSSSFSLFFYWWYRLEGFILADLYLHVTHLDHLPAPPLSAIPPPSFAVWECWCIHFARLCPPITCPTPLS